MNEISTKRAAASLNLLLPGLGHLYLKYPMRAIVLFLAFALVLTQPLGGLWALVVAIIAAIEIHSKASAFSEKSPRYVVFIAGGVVGFLLWVFELIVALARVTGGFA